jgi:hypothetical protein
MPKWYGLQGLIIIIMAGDAALQQGRERCFGLASRLLVCLRHVLAVVYIACWAASAWQEM